MKKKITLFFILLIGITAGVALITYGVSGASNKEVYVEGRFSKLSKDGEKIPMLKSTEIKNGANGSNSDKSESKNDIKIEAVKDKKGNLKSTEQKGPANRINTAKDELSNINFPNLQNKVPNLIGWLSIPEIGIDQPIAQANDNEYYLNHNIFDEEDPAGSVFLEANSSLHDPVKYIYGHYWTKNDMFGPLGKLINDRYPYTNAVLTDENNNIKEYKLLGLKSTNTDKGYNMQHFNEINDEFNDWSEEYYNSHANYYKYNGFKYNKEVLILVTCHSDPSQPGRIIAYFQEV